MNYRGAGVSAIALLFFTAISSPGAQEQSGKVQVVPVLRELVKRSTLEEQGGNAFYMKAKVLDEKNADWEYNAVVEEHWVSPSKWRRTIRSKGFSQILIVNGDQRFEQNTGGYFPPDVEREIVSLVHPLPDNVIQTFEKLAMEIQKPNGQPGQCFADQYFIDEQGERARVAVALNSKTDLLNYLWFPGWDVGVFADYRSFHHKLIAWKTKDNPVNAEIEELRELEHPDKTLFAIKEMTPVNERIRTVMVNGAEFKKQATKAPELKWPAVSGPPVSGTVNVDIVTDRNGRVRHVQSHLASNRELQAWTVEQVKDWEFKPYLVEGIPVQVESTFEIDFKTELKAGTPNLLAASDYFDRARQLSRLRGEGAQAFHLKASFEAFGNAELTGKGTYEETWVSPKQWRKEAHLSGHSVIETRNGDLWYRKIDRAYSPRRIDEAMDAVGAGVPMGDGPPGMPSWQVAKAQLGNTALIRVWRGKIADNGVPDAYAKIYYFSPDNGLLRGCHDKSELTLYNEFEEFSGKMVARSLSVLDNASQTLEIKIDQLEVAPPQTTDIYTLAGVKPISSASENPGEKSVLPIPIKTVTPDYPADVRAQREHGKTVCQLLIDSHGHVREVRFPEKVNPIVENAMRAAAMQWEFSPGTSNGFPVESLRPVEFKY